MEKMRTCRHRSSTYTDHHQPIILEDLPFVVLKGSAYNNDVMMTDLPKRFILFLCKVEVKYMKEPCNAC